MITTTGKFILAMLALLLTLLAALLWLVLGGAEDAMAGECSPSDRICDSDVIDRASSPYDACFESCFAGPSHRYDVCQRSVDARPRCAFDLRVAHDTCLDACRGVGDARLAAATRVTVDADPEEPMPVPTHTRRDNRPEATPNPLHPILDLAVVSGPVLFLPTSSRQAPAEVRLKCRLLDRDSGVHRCRLWLKTPQQDPTPKTPAYCSKMTSLREDGEGTVTCKLNWRAPRGRWLACSYVPDEPGAQYAGLMEPCQTIEVR